MPLANGTRLGPYEITAPIGAGGMGEVYRARDTRLDRVVAIKVLPAALARDAEFRDRFDREAHAISRLAHQNICTLYDVGHQADVAFLVLEHIDGSTLAQWLAGNPKPPIERLIDLALQIAQALAAAHTAGIVHRDVKPANVVVSQDRFVKVLDFGVAKLVNRRPDLDAATVAPAHTAAGLVVGTTKYMSPEQARGLPVDERSDIFSFGILLYEMLAGRAPFQGATATDTIVAILERQPPALAEQRADIPGALQRIVMRCLEKDVERRYASAGDLVVELERVRGENSARHAAVKSAPSIAVLPFVNMSNDPENEYFCDGIAEDLIGALTKIDQLHVAARTSAFSFKGKNADLKDVGRALNVGTVLEGSVRKAGNRLRVSAQLVSVADGYQLWSERYDRQLEDVFAIQDEISLAIVTALKVKLLGHEQVAVARRHTDNIEAYQLYLKGRHHWHKWTAGELAKSRECMEHAIALDPDYALAHVGLADTYLASGPAGLIPLAELLPKAKPALARALELDPDLAEAWTLMGVVRLFEWDWEAAERATSRAVELNPRLGHAYLVRALSRLNSGSSTIGFDDARRAVELEPLVPLWRHSLVQACVATGDDDGAMKEIDALLDIDPGFWWGHYMRGLLALARGEWAAAVQSAAEAVRCSGEGPYAVGLLICALVMSGDRERGEHELAALLARAKAGHVPAFALALACRGVDPSGRLFEYLDRSIEERDQLLPFHMRYARHFNELRGDPRMIDFRRRLAQAGVRLTE